MKKLITLLLVLALFLTLCSPALAFSIQLSAQELVVDGKTVECEKYNIDGSNYFKLRDLAQLLNGTGSQFDVGWDGAMGVVSITTNHSYTSPNGHELELSGDNSATAQLSSQTILIDGTLQTDLTVYNIGGSNFFKLRELGERLGFSVDYAALSNTAIITSAPIRGAADPGNIPGFNDPPTQENILSLLDAYDPDGAYIVRESARLDPSFDPLVWYFPGESVSEGIGTVVHEECHSISFVQLHCDDYYVGDGRSISVRNTDIFNSKEMIPMIPDRLKTFRYDTYIEDPDAPSSATDGVYGLLNEFMAYCWGMNCIVCLYDYYRDYGGGETDAWFQYISSGGNIRLAYGEFLYYILTYMLYAEANHPDIYEGIISNDDLRLAFTALESKYASVNRRFEESLDEITGILQASGVRTTISADYFFIETRGTKLYSEDYEALLEAIGQPEYQRMLGVLRS